MSASKGKPYRLKPTALRDLEEIWFFTAERWSQDQADTYLNGIAGAFERIAQNPKIVRERHEYVPPVRICRHEAHIIVFIEEADHVAIIRVRHGNEDWASDPEGDA